MIINADVLTVDPSRPRARAQAVAVAQERIQAVGSNDEIRGLCGPDTQVIDGQGLTLLPGLIDSHCHLLSLARTTQELDCRPDKVPSVKAIAHRVFEWARIVPPGEWVRCFGYDHLALEESRHPTHHDLDHISPRHPVRLDHRSGHATVLNSMGLQMAGITADTPDPVEGVIERDTNGEPTGVLFEMSAYLSQRMDGGRSQAKIKQGVTAANRLLLSCGVTSVQDAGPENGPERWQAFRDLVDSGTLETRVTMMAGSGRRAELLDAGLSWGATGGSGDHHVRLGHVKVMLTMSTGALHPSLEELRRSGFPLAVHCVGQEAVAAAAQVISELPPLPPGVPPHRIEHCSECPPEVLAAVQRSGAAVVTQPGFIHWNGPGYRKTVDSSLQSHLYAIGAIEAAGVSVAFGSDAPVIHPNPWPAIHSAVTRRDHKGRPFPETGDSGRVSAQSALRMYTLSGAESEGTQAHKGSITPGKLADLVVVDADPLTVDPEGLKDIKAKMTMVGGRVVWEGG